MCRAMSVIKIKFSFPVVRSSILSGIIFFSPICFATQVSQQLDTIKVTATSLAESGSSSKSITKFQHELLS
jgi:hypothetical protein